MVLRAQPTNAANLDGLAFASDQFYIWPADRCVWQQENSTDGNGYRIRAAHFFPGAAVNQGAAVGAANDAIQLSNAVLGVIGKSGRFVAITDAS